MVRIRAGYALVLPLILVAAGFTGWAAHRPDVHRAPQFTRISRGMSNDAIIKHFNLGTNSRGRPAFTHFKCGKTACEWVYGGPKRGLMAVLVLAMPAGSIPHGPPRGDN